MGIEKSLARYVNAAVAHGEAIQNGNYKVANKQHDVIMKSLHKLYVAGKRGEALSALLDHRDPHVRGWAATHLININTEKAIQVLEALLDEGGLVGFEAETTLKLWKECKLKIP